MKRSVKIKLGIIPSVAAAAMISGCGSGSGYQTDVVPATHDWQNCVDKNNKVVDEKYCASAPKAGAAGTHTSGGSNNALLYYWLFTRGSQPLAPGSYAVGGSRTYTPSVAGATPLRPSAAGSISRGGFGSTGGGYSAGS